jgi:hypothetical protein
MKSKFLTVTLVIILIFAMVPSVSAGKSTGGYQTGFVKWEATGNGFSSWALSGVDLNNGALTLNPATASAGTDPYTPGNYFDKNYYNGGSFLVGEATSPTFTTAFNYKEAIASWNASTPAGTWVEVQIRAQFGTRWSKWYTYGVWASDYSTVERHSVSAQGDADGSVYIDTFVVLAKKTATNAFQIKVLLFSEDGVAVPSVPSVKNIGVAYSSSVPSKAPAVSAGNPSNWNTLLNLPECSQMVYRDGGTVWCSPTSTSMVLGYWGDDATSCEERVRAAVSGVFDWKYDGHGNWPFNTAYAAAQGRTAYVTRFVNLEKVEQFVKADVPVVISIAWGKGDLTGAPIPSSPGHLMVVVGFDANGNPIVNDPASATDADVQRTYLRSELEGLWLTASGGTVYLIYPEGHSIPSMP